MNKSYPRWYLLSFLPITLLFLQPSLDNLGTPRHILLPLLLVSVVTSIVIFVRQTILSYRSSDFHQLAVLQLAITFGSGVAMATAISYGDVTGAAHFNDSDGTSTTILDIVGIIAACAAFFATLFAFSNTLHLMTGTKNRVLNVLAKICYVILWLIVAGVSYIAYSLTYTAHDPSSD